MNNFIAQIQAAKESNNVVAYYVYKAWHCNQMAIFRSGLTKEAFLARRDLYMATARSTKLGNTK